MALIEPCLSWYNHGSPWLLSIANHDLTMFLLWFDYDKTCISYCGMYHLYDYGQTWIFIVCDYDNVMNNHALLQLVVWTFNCEHSILCLSIWWYSMWLNYQCVVMDCYFVIFHYRMQPTMVGNCLTLVTMSRLPHSLEKMVPILVLQFENDPFFVAKHWLFSSKRPLFNDKTLTFLSKITPLFCGKTLTFQLKWTPLFTVKHWT